MTENTQRNPEPEVTEENPLTQPSPKQPVSDQTVGSATEPTAKAVETSEPKASPPEDESTIGTGTSMALGCIAGTVVLIIFGLLFLFLSSFI